VIVPGVPFSMDFLRPGRFGVPFSQLLQHDAVPFEMDFLHPGRFARPFSMDFQSADEAEFWMDFKGVSRFGRPLRFDVASRCLVPFSQPIRHDAVPFGMDFLRPGRCSVPFSMDFQSFDELGVLSFRLRRHDETVPLFDGATLELGPCGEGVATVTTSARCEVGEELGVVALAGELEIPLFRGVVSRVEYDATEGLCRVTARDPIGARLGGRVATRGGSPLECLASVAAEAGAYLQIGTIGVPVPGVLVDVEATVPWLEYAQSAEALARGTLSWSADGYVFDGTEQEWKIPESDAFAFKESVEVGQYVNAVALVVDDSWVVPAVRKVVTSPFEGGVVVRDAAGDQVYRATVRPGTRVSSDSAWKYNERAEVVWEASCAGNVRSETTYTVGGDPHIVLRKVTVTGWLPGAPRPPESAGAPERSWDTWEETVVAMVATSNGWSVTKTVTRRYWEKGQAIGGVNDPDEPYAWTWPPGGAAGGYQPPPTTSPVVTPYQPKWPPGTRW